MDTTDAPQIIEHIHQNVDFTPYETRWVPCSARMVALGIAPRGHGVLKTYELSKGDLKEVQNKQWANGFKCGTFGASSIALFARVAGGIYTKAAPPCPSGAPPQLC